MGVTNRVYQIHNYIKDGQRVTIKRLAEMFEVSERTIKRDIDLLRDQLGAPLVYDAKQQRYLYAPDAPTFELPGLWLNQTELYALLAMEQLLEEVQPGLLGPYLGPLKGRIRKLLAQGGHDGEAVSTRIHLQPVAHRRLDNEHFGMVAGSVLNGTPLVITYRGRGSGETSRRTVHPYRLQHYRDNWYLVAWCTKAQALRVFSVDRIDSADIRDIPLQSVDGQQLARFLNASFGIFSGEAGEWAVLRFTAERARWVADEQWHPDQIGQWKDGVYELQIPYSNPTELLMDILKYGPDVEVLAPDALRKQVAERLKNAARQYERDTL